MKSKSVLVVLLSFLLLFTHLSYALQWKIENVCEGTFNEYKSAVSSSGILGIAYNTTAGSEALRCHIRDVNGVWTKVICPAINVDTRSFGFGLLSDSRPAFSYVRSTSKWLNYTYKNVESNWTDESVAPLDNEHTTFLTYHDLVILPNDIPAVAYCFTFQWYEYQLRYAQKDSSWRIQVLLDYPLYTTSTVLRTQNNNQVALCHQHLVANPQSTWVLEYMYSDNNVWSTAPRIISTINQTLCFDFDLYPDDKPFVSWIDEIGEKVMCASLESGAWLKEEIDTGYFREQLAVAVSSGGTPIIAYYDQDIPMLKYAYKVGGRWYIETVADGQSPWGLELIALDNNKIVIFFPLNGHTVYAETVLPTIICSEAIAGDVNGDCVVDFKDFAYMVSNWLEDNRE